MRHLTFYDFYDPWPQISIVVHGLIVYGGRVCDFKLTYWM